MGRPRPLSSPWERTHCEALGGHWAPRGSAGARAAGRAAETRPSRKPQVALQGAARNRPREGREKQRHGHAGSRVPEPRTRHCRHDSRVGGKVDQGQAEGSGNVSRTTATQPQKALLPPQSNVVAPIPGGGPGVKTGRQEPPCRPRGLAPLGRDPGPRPGLGCQTASGSTRSESTAKWLTTGAQTTRLRLKSTSVPSHTRHTPLHVTGSWVTRQSPLPRAHGPGVSRRRWRSLGLSGQHPSEADSLAPHGTLSCQGHPPVPAAAATSSRLTLRRCSDHICEKGWLRWRKGRTACP